MISAVSALQAQESFQLTTQHGLMGRRSPPRGGIDLAAANQQILASSDEEVDAASVVPPERSPADKGSKVKKARKASKRQRLEEAERFLLSHGIDPRAAAQSGDSKHKHKKKARKT